MVLVELLLVVGVYGGVRAWRDRQVLAHGREVTAEVTRTAKHCKGSDCTYDSYGAYAVGGSRERDVLLRCCASSPLPARVSLRVDPGSPRSPVVAGSGTTGPLWLGAGALALLVGGNTVLLTVVLRRRRTV